MMLAASSREDEELNVLHFASKEHKMCILYKMTFTNFKSYAGIQVVGPFDNVSHLPHCFMVFSHSRRSLVQMALGNQTSLTVFFLYLDSDRPSFASPRPWI